MKLMALTNHERLQTGFTHKFSAKFSDLTTAGLTQTLNILPTGTGVFAAGFGIRRAAIRLITPFTGGAIATMVADLGDAASVNRYIANANTDLFTALATNTKPHVFSSTGYIYNPKNIVTDVATNIQLKFTSTVGNVNAATAGEVEVYLDAFDFADFARPNSFP